MVNKVRVNIAGTPYAIATTDPEKYILSLAKKLDEDITKLLDDNANLSVTKAAVFCAMDYLDEYRKSTGSAENMRSQIQDYIADATRAKLAEDKVKAENEVLRREAAALREQLEKMRNKEARREERAQQAAQQSAAEGEAQAILAVQKANADAIRLLNEAMPSDKVLAIRSLEALAKVANGKATKIIIPSELQNLGGVVPSIKELMTDPKDAE